LVFELWKKLNDKNFSALNIIYGTESYLIEKTKKLFIENALKKEELEFNFSAIDLDEVPIEIAIEEMELFPFFGDRRVVFLNNAFFFSAEKRREKVDHNIEKLLEYIKNPTSFTIAVFIVPTPKLDERKKITKEILKSAYVLDAKPLREIDLINWVKDMAFQNKLNFHPKSIEKLIFLTGGNITLLSSEIEKLSLFVQSGEVVTDEVLELVVAKSLDQNVFTLIDKIMKRQKDAAIQIYHDLLIQKEEPIRILAAIARQYRILSHVKFLSGEGYSESAIATKIKENPYPVKLAKQMIHNFSSDYLAKVLHELAEIDYKMKTGQGDKELLLDLFILKS
jgi:DNA polymerase-3 subunit delta